MAASRVQVDKCDKCSNYYVCNSIHRCIAAEPVAIEEPKKYVQEKLSLFDNLDDDDTIYNEDNEKGNNESEILYSNLISAIEVRRPLYDHRLSLSKRSEAIKTKLWNEIYVELKGQISIDELKKKWRYLREKFVRERQKPKSGAKGGIKKNWVHYIQLSFLEDVVTHDKKTTSNLENNNTDDYSQIITTKEQKRKPKNDNDFHKDLLNELKMTRPTLPELIKEDPHDPDVDFGKYLVSLIKEVPPKKRKKLQCQIITTVINAQDTE